MGERHLRQQQISIRHRAITLAPQEPSTQQYCLTECRESWTKVAINIVALIRDLVIIALNIGEGSFTGSAGTKYEVGDSRNIGGFIFVWLCVNLGIGVARNLFCPCSTMLGEIDLTSVLVYSCSVLAVAQYGRFIDLDYIELGTTGQSVGFWGELNRIQTLGNTPDQPPSAKAVSWALVELFVYTLIVIDSIYCVHLILGPVRRCLERKTHTYE